MSEQGTTKEQVTLHLDDGRWAPITFKPPDGDGHLNIDIDGKFHQAETWITLAEARAIRDWLNEVLR